MVFGKEVKLTSFADDATYFLLNIASVYQLFRVLINNNSNKTNDLILNLTPENVTQHSRIVTTTHKGSSTPTKMSKIIGRQIH